MAASHGKKNIIAGNWKMNLGVAASRALATALRDNAASLKRSEVWVAPSTMALAAVSESVKGSAIQVGAQNICHQRNGAYTGEISVDMAREVGCSFALVGHSERRNVFGETNELCVERAKAAIGQQFIAMLCVGETLEERESGRTFSVIEEQLIPVLKDLKEGQAKFLVIAYEPVWAIGTGKVASTEQIAEVHAFIAKIAAEYLGSDAVPPILYGGSVTADNFASIIALENVSGALVGGASLSVEKFGPLLRISEA